MSFPTSDEDIRALRVKVLRALAAAQYPKESIGLVAASHKLTVDDVKSLVEKYGYPDAQAMRRHAFELSTSADQPQTARPTPAPRPTAPRPTAARQPDQQPNMVEALLATGERSTKARTRNLSKKIAEMLVDLRAAVLDERKAHEQAERKARLKAEVAELERQLVEKKKALVGRKPGKSSTTPAGNAAEIRAWAAKHSVACPAFGRVPGDVVEAYELSTRQAG